MPKQNPAAVREAAERLLSRNPRSYRAQLELLQGAQRVSDLVPLVMTVLTEAAKMAKQKPAGRQQALGPPEELPLFSGEAEGLGGAMVPKPKQEEMPSRFTILVKPAERGGSDLFLVPQTWVDFWAESYQLDGEPEGSGLRFVEECIEAATRWQFKQQPSKRKTEGGMKRFLGTWMESAWTDGRGGGRRTTGVAVAGGIRPPSRLGKSNATMQRLVAEAVAKGNIEEMPF